ncbi:hypothetical protein [Blastopirellula retiformator]|uniref:hypothetical protein n=1 Tax=Blastopirellula retiformator TaxID=2527970 RepID=UPI001C953A76|nr:hypothetical protein [Blastopirellula retiformator]
MLLAVLYLLGIAIAFPDNPSVLLSLPFTMLIFGAVFAFLGALSGLLVGLVAMLTRDSSWRSVPQFVSCATMPPLLFAGPFIAIAYWVRVPITPTIMIITAILLFCGMLMGVFLFRRVQSPAHAMFANRAALLRGGELD